MSTKPSKEAEEVADRVFYCVSRANAAIRIQRALDKARDDALVEALAIVTPHSNRGNVAAMHIREEIEALRRKEP